MRGGVNDTSEAMSAFGDVLKANIISDAVHTGLQKTVDSVLSLAAASGEDLGTTAENFSIIFGSRYYVNRV